MIKKTWMGQSPKTLATATWQSPWPPTHYTGPRRGTEAYVQPTVLAWSAAAGGLNDDAVKLAEQARPRNRRSPGGAAHRRRHPAGGVGDVKGSDAFGAHPREVARVTAVVSADHEHHIKALASPRKGQYARSPRRRLCNRPTVTRRCRMLRPEGQRALAWEPGTWSGPDAWQ